MNRPTLTLPESRVDAVGLFDDRHQLLDHPGHPVGVGQVAVGETGVDQVQRQTDRLGAGQLDVAALVDRPQQGLGLKVLVGVEVLHLGEQGIDDVHAQADPADGEADVVGEGDHHGRVLAHRVQPGRRDRLADQLDVLGRDPGQQFGEVIGVATVGRDEGADHLAGVHPMTGPGLEPQAAAGQDDLAPPLVQSEDEVVVEDADDFHAFTPVAAPERGRPPATPFRPRCR
ncbi:MAG: hypothetical protein QM582_15475 [Micropruina sp.]